MGKSENLKTSTLSKVWLADVPKTEAKQIQEGVVADIHMAGVKGSQLYHDAFLDEPSNDDADFVGIYRPLNFEI